MVDPNALLDYCALRVFALCGERKRERKKEKKKEKFTLWEGMMKPLMNPVEELSQGRKNFPS